jgi:hypothetical protein
MLARPTVDPNAPQVQDLLLLGTSMGGARPKAVVQDDDGLKPVPARLAAERAGLQVESAPLAADGADLFHSIALYIIKDARTATAAAISGRFPL